LPVGQAIDGGGLRIALHLSAKLTLRLFHISWRPSSRGDMPFLPNVEVA
jgi:hypothetical protein